MRSVVIDGPDSWSRVCGLLRLALCLFVNVCWARHARCGHLLRSRVLCAHPCRPAAPGDGGRR